MSTYVKVFSSILESTVWQEPLHVRVVWVSMLAMADRDGVVEASVPGLAKRAGVTREQAEEAIAVFLAPDPDSRTPDHEGRRIAKVDGGWVLLNHDKYREKASPDEKREKAAIRQQRKRDRDAERDARDSSRSVTLRHASHAPSRTVTPSEAETDQIQSESSEHALASPITAQEMLGKPKPPPSLMSQLVEAMSQETFEIAKERNEAPPREAHSMWDGWRVVAAYVRDTAAARGWDGPEAVQNARALLRAFYASEDPKTKKAAYKLSFLKGNPAQYAAEARKVAA